MSIPCLFIWESPPPAGPNPTKQSFSLSHNTYQGFFVQYPFQCIQAQGETTNILTSYWLMSSLHTISYPVCWNEGNETRNFYFVISYGKSNAQGWGTYRFGYHQLTQESEPVLLPEITAGHMRFAIGNLHQWETCLPKIEKLYEISWIIFSAEFQWRKGVKYLTKVVIVFSEPSALKGCRICSGKVDCLTWLVSCSANSFGKVPNVLIWITTCDIRVQVTIVTWEMKYPQLYFLFHSIVTKTEQMMLRSSLGLFGYFVPISAQFVFNVLEICNIFQKMRRVAWNSNNVTIWQHWMKFCDCRKINNHILYKPENKLPHHFPNLVGLYREKPCPWSWIHDDWGPHRDSWCINNINIIFFKLGHRHGRQLAWPTSYWGGTKAGPDRVAEIKPTYRGDVDVSNWLVHNTDWLN